MALLVGRHVNKIDSKGRVSVPKPFRAALARDRAAADADAFLGLYAFPSFKYPALEAGGESFMQRFVDGVDGLDVFSDDQDDLASVVLGRTRELPMDPEGRIVLPEEFLKHAGIKDEVAFVGLGRSLMIWEPHAHEAYQADRLSSAQAKRLTVKSTKRPGAMAGEGGDG